MYSYEERIRAIKFYINCGYNAAYTVRKLGYPDVYQIPRQYKEYINNKDLHKERVKWFKYSDKEKRLAVDYYFENGRNALKTVKALGYPSRPLLIEWVNELNPEECEIYCKGVRIRVECK